MSTKFTAQEVFDAHERIKDYIKNTKIIVPENTPKAKVDKIKFYGVDAMLMGIGYDEAHTQGMKFIEENGMTYI